MNPGLPRPWRGAIAARPWEFETAIRESLAMDSLESEELEKQCKTYIERCFSSEAHQQALRNILPAELLTRIDTKRLATEEMGWPDPLKGAQLNGLTLLATSRG